MTEAPLRLAGLDRALVFGFWLAYVLVGAQTTIATDTARDLIAAWDIVQGTHYPLRGPELYSTWTLGPIWYYLLALPLKLTHSAAVAIWMVAILAGLKFSLAYRLGAEFGGVQLARLSVLAIALPGWWMFEWLVTSHTNLAVPCLLGYALWLLRWARGGGAIALGLAGLLFSLSVHAHPTSLFWAWLAVPALWSRRAALHAIPWAHLFGAVALFLLPFLPMLADEAAHAWPMLGGTRDFVATRQGPALLPRLLPFLADLIALNGQRMVGQVLADGDSMRRVLVAMLTLPWLLAMLGLLYWKHRPGIKAIAILASLAGATFLLWLRPEIPFWMVYALMPGLAAVLALCWQSALSIAPERQRAVTLNLLTGFIAIAFLIVAGQRWMDAADAWVRVPYRVVGPYADPHKQVDISVPNPAFPVAGQERWTRWLCAQPNVLSLHGDAAALQGMSQGILHALHCPQAQNWQIGGARGESVALYSLAALRALGETPLQQFGGMGRLNVDAVLRAAEALPDELVRAYPPWPLTQQTTTEFVLPVQTKSAQLLAVSNLRVIFNGLDAPELVIDGHRLAPVTRSAATWFFRVPARASGTLTVRSGDPRWIEVLALPDSLHD
jgi:hypothetical protein